MLSHGLVGRVVVRLPKTAASNFVRLSQETEQSLFTRCALRCVAHRPYATTTARPKATASKPKARTASKTTTKRPAGTRVKSTTARKPAKRVAKKKPAPKKPKVKKMTEAQKARAARRKAIQEVKDLKEQALTEPKRKLDNPFLIVAMEEQGPQKGVVGAMKTASTKYKALAPAELERYTHLANEAKAANEAAYKKWVQSHTPETIRLANAARSRLKTLQLKEKKTPSNPHPLPGLMSAKTRKIQDDRQVTRPRPSMTIFVGERFATGDYKHLKATEAMKLISEEFKKLSATEKKKYEDQYQQDKSRYAREFKSVYGRDPPSTPPRKARAAA